MAAAPEPTTATTTVSEDEAVRPLDPVPAHPDEPTPAEAPAAQDAPAATPAAAQDAPAATPAGQEAPAGTAAAQEAPAGAPAGQEAPAGTAAAQEAPAGAPAGQEAPVGTAAAQEAPAGAPAGQEAPVGTAAAQEAPSAAPVETMAPIPTETPAAPAARVAEIDPIVTQVREQLAGSKLRDVTAAERAALTAFYADRTTPVWATAQGFTARGRHAVDEIARADDWGLDAKAFVLPQPASGDLTPEAAADAEIKISVAVLKYARYARGGRLDPSQVSRNFDQKVTLRDPKVVLETVAGLDTPGSYLRSLHPQHPQFELLRQALLKVRAGAAKAEEEDVVRLPDGPPLKLGVQHPDVALLRQRLKLPSTAGADDVYDQQLADAVIEYQRKNGMRPDGIVGARTRAALNGTDKSMPAYGSEEQRLIVNMERWRWMPEDMGEFYVWDNVPEFQTRVVKNGQVIHQAKIIVGKPETQTTIFSADMKYIIFGPEWGVPDSIKVKELLPYLRPTYEPSFFGFGGTVTDTRILEKHNLRVSLNGKPVDPSQINWREVDIRKYSFIQPAGPNNALGAVKFRFPNKHDIYMHDTPQRELFDRTVRMFSHGCVRVQNPGRFAEILLEEDKGWPASRVRELMARGGNNQVTLSKQIPVHITYFTTVASEDGQVRSFGDVYGHDRRVAAALAGRPMPLEPAPTLTVDVPAKREIKEARSKRYNPSEEDPFSALFGN